MRIIFFGSPASALPSLKGLLDAGHGIELVITQPDQPSGRGKAFLPPPVKTFALQAGLSILQPQKIRKDELALEKIRAAAPDINVIVAYGQIIPSSIIYLPRYHSVNVHFSLLPKYRGAAPVQWAILNGETKTGLTIFELNEKMDEGDILAQQEVEILSHEKAYELEARLAQKGARFLLKTLAELATIKPAIKQDHSQASYAPKLEKDQGRIHWTRDAVIIDRQVRAFASWPGAFTHFQGQRIIIREGKDLHGRTNTGSAGQVLAIYREGIEVGCGQGTVYLIQRLQRESKKEMEAYAFSLGTKLNPGDFLD